MLRLACGHVIGVGDRAELKDNGEDGHWMGFCLVGTEVIDPLFVYAYCEHGDGWQTFEREQAETPVEETLF